MNSYKGEIKNFKKKNNFRGYKQAQLPKSDEKISRTDIGTPCGEYLRQYWHPVALTSEVSTTPIKIRILGDAKYANSNKLPWCFAPRVVPTTITTPLSTV